MGWWASTFDLIQLRNDLGIVLVVAIFLAVVLSVIYWGQIKRYWAKQNKAADNIEDMHKSSKDPADPRDERLISQNDLLQAILYVSKTVETRCGSASCPLVPIITQKVAHLEETVQRAVSDIEKGRDVKTAEFLRIQEDNNRSINLILDRINTFLEQVVSPLIGVIRNGKR